MTETFQIPIEAAEAYEARFVPAIFREWAPRAIAAGGVHPTTRLLDVACGTGIVARTADGIISDAGRVVGVDLNESMLQVARSVAPTIDWQRSDVTSLPFPDAAFDVVICQMAMMFFPDRPGAIGEMRRVLAPGGRLVTVVPAVLDRQPGYRTFVDAAVAHAGPDAVSLLGTYWSCGDLDELVGMLSTAGCSVTGAATIEGSAHFASVEDFVSTEIAGSPLSERIDESTAELIVADVRRALAPDSSRDGFVTPLVCHVVTATA